MTENQHALAVKLDPEPAPARAQTLPGTFYATCARRGGATMCRTVGGGRRASHAWDAVATRVRRLSWGLMRRGLSRGDRVVIVGRGSLEWLVCDLAVMAAGGVTVGVRADAALERLLHVVGRSGARLAIVGDSLTAALLSSHADRHALETILVHGTSPEDSDEIGLHSKVRVQPLASVVDASRADTRDARRAVLARTNALRASDLATLIYTSGTTGPPKGVALTHANLLHGTRTLREVLPLGSDDVAAICLPLSQVHQRLMAYSALLAGTVTVFTDSWPELLEALGEVRPTILSAGPQRYEQLRDHLVAELTRGGHSAERLVRWALSTAIKADDASSSGRLSPALRIQHGLAERLVLRRIRAQLGGRIRCLVGRARPVEPEVRRFFRACGVRLVDGYGLTETAGLVTVASPRLPPEVLGRPVAGVELRLDDEGEVLVRGDGVFEGYFDEPEATRAVLDESGWFRTGDIASLDLDGNLTLRGRKDDVVTTASGARIVPHAIERALRDHPLVADVCVLAGRSQGLVALFTLDERGARAWAEAQSLSYDDVGDLADKPDLLDVLHNHVGRVNAALPSLETVERFGVLPVPFRVEDGTRTARGTLRRHAVEARYAALLDQLG